VSLLDCTVDEVVAYVTPSASYDELSNRFDLCLSVNVFAYLSTVAFTEIQCTFSLMR